MSEELKGNVLEIVLENRKFNIDFLGETDIEVDNLNVFTFRMTNFLSNGNYRFVILFNNLMFCELDLIENNYQCEIDTIEFARFFIKQYPQYKYSLISLIPNIEKYLMFS
jgi:hypothetical protein